MLLHNETNARLLKFKKLMIYLLYLDTLGIQSILGHNLDQLREVVGVPTSRCKQLNQQAPYY